MLKVDLKPGEKLQIGEATLVFVQKSGQLASFAIDADRSIPVRKITDEAQASGNQVFSRGLATA